MGNVLDRSVTGKSIPATHKPTSPPHRLPLLCSSTTTSTTSRFTTTLYRLSGRNECFPSNFPVSYVIPGALSTGSPPGPPIYSRSVEPGDSTLTLFFNPPADTDPAIVTGYTISVTSADDRSFELITPASPFTIPNLTNGQAYAVKVRAETSEGKGKWSNKLLGLMPGESFLRSKRKGG